MSTKCDLCEAQENGRDDLLNQEAVVRVISRLISGSYDGDMEIAQHISLAGALCVDALFARFGKDTTMEFITHLHKTYSSKESSQDSDFWSVSTKRDCSANECGDCAKVIH